MQLLCRASIELVEKIIFLSYDNQLSGDYSEWEPPDSIPNSEVKTLSADDSVDYVYVKVGHRQALKTKNPHCE